MTLTRTRQLYLLVLILAIIAIVNLYLWLAQEPAATRPLTYTRGMSVTSPVRRGIAAAGTAAADPLTVFLARRGEEYPGVKRDLFRTAGDGAVRPKPAVASRPAVTADMPPQRTPEEIAADNARADLSRFRFLGYLTDRDSSLFLSKDGELFIAKSGDVLLKGYRIKSAGKDHVVLQDTATNVEVRVELTGSGDVKTK